MMRLLPTLEDRERERLIQQALEARLDNTPGINPQGAYLEVLQNWQKDFQVRIVLPGRGLYESHRVAQQRVYEPGIQREADVRRAIEWAYNDVVAMLSFPMVMPCG